MRCYCCSGLLPILVSHFYDARTDRFYCHQCISDIGEFYIMMYGPKIPNKDNEDILLDEDFDDFYIEPDDFLDVPLDEEELDGFNLPPENYDE